MPGRELAKIVIFLDVFAFTFVGIFGIMQSISFIEEWFSFILRSNIEGHEI